MQSGDINALLLYAAIIILCAVRARNRGRSVLGWALFAFLLAPLAIIITWFVGPKKRIAPPVTVPTPKQPALKVPSPSQASTPASPTRRSAVSAPTPLAPVSSAPTVPAIISTQATPGPNATLIDVTGHDQPLLFQGEQSVLPPVVPTSPAQAPISYNAPDYGYEMPRLGKQYRKKLGLTKQQVAWLDTFWSPQNVFLAIESCRVATVKLYLQALALLEQSLAERNSSLAQETERVQQESLRLRKASVAAAGYTWHSYDEQYHRETGQAILYSTLFKRCENVVREAYGNKRRLAAEFSGLEGDLGAQLQIRLGQPLDALLPSLQETIELPDESTEIALNLQNVTRWKPQLEALAAQLRAATVPAFVAGVYQLGQRNARNPAVENIFFDASKLVAKLDQPEALRFYLHYVYHDLRSATINSKPLTKTIQKSLFPQPDQLQRFEAIVQQLTVSQDLEQALAQLPTVYAQQRKKIQLDRSTIEQVQHQHAGTVELLNDYLQDEPEMELGAVPAPAAHPVAPLSLGESEEIQLSVPVTTSSAAPVATGAFHSAVALTEPQQLLLSLFAEHQLTMPQTEVEGFARQHGLLRNQLIDSINEQCYDLLDDVLIEEEGDHYTIYDSYYQQLAIPC